MTVKKNDEAVVLFSKTRLEYNMRWTQFEYRVLLFFKGCIQEFGILLAAMHGDQNVTPIIMSSVNMTNIVKFLNAT